MFEKMKIRYYIGLFLLMVLGWQFAISMAVMPKELENIIDIFPLELSAVLFFGYYFYKQKISLSIVVYDQQDSKWSLPSLIGIVLIFNTFSLTTYWLYLLIQDSFFILEPFIVKPFPGSSLLLIAMMIKSTVTGPIVEEFICRGLLLNRLIKKTTMWGGILISSSVFAALHLQTEKLIATFLFGIVASLIYLKTKNLFIPILIHILHNSLAFIQTSVFPKWMEFLFFTSSDDFHTNVVVKSTLLVISSILMTAVIVYLVKDLRTDKKKVEMLPQPEGIH